LCSRGWDEGWLVSQQVCGLNLYSVQLLLFFCYFTLHLNVVEWLALVFHIQLSGWNLHVFDWTCFHLMLFCGFSITYFKEDLPLPTKSLSNDLLFCHFYSVPFMQLGGPQSKSVQF
jgi:hypothetical protein